MDIKLRKPTMASANRFAERAWGIVRHNMLNSELATKRISEKIHAAAMKIYDAATDELKGLDAKHCETIADLRSKIKSLRATVKDLEELANVQKHEMESMSAKIETLEKIIERKKKPKTGTATNEEVEEVAKAVMSHSDGK